MRIFEEKTNKQVISFLLKENMRESVILLRGDKVRTKNETIFQKKKANIKKQMLKLERLNKENKLYAQKFLLDRLKTKEEIVDFIKENFMLFYFFYDSNSIELAYDMEEGEVVPEFLNKLHEKVGKNTDLIDFKGEFGIYVYDVGSIQIEGEWIETVYSENEFLDGYTYGENYSLEEWFNPIKIHIKSTISDEEIANSLLPYDCSKCKYLTICKDKFVSWEDCFKGKKKNETIEVTIEERFNIFTIEINLNEIEKVKNFRYDQKEKRVTFTFDENGKTFHCFSKNVSYDSRKILIRKENEQKAKEYEKKVLEKNNDITR